MPRTREFDPQKTLEKAMQLFWQRGYADTSMRDLVEYTGVAHAGLYSAFGSKQGLYEAALRYYRDTTMKRLLADLETADAGQAALEAFFDRILDMIRAGQFEDGCLMVNTAIEFGDTVQAEHSILGLVSQHMERLRSAFEQALIRAKQQEAVQPDCDPQALADFLVTVFNGVTVMARAKTDYQRIENTVRIALKEIQ